MGIYSERIFPVINDWVTGSVAGARAGLLAEAAGDVLEIGLGSGLSLEHYPAAVRRLVGVEPSEGMRRRARTRMAGRLGATAGRILEVVEGSAEELPFAEASFDTAVSFLVLCTVPDAGRAVAELRRVLRPGGSLLFFEHVIHPSGRLRWAQKAFNPLWRPLACGCNLDRDTEALLERGGFGFERLERIDSDTMPKLVSRIIRGRAIKK